MESVPPNVDNQMIDNLIDGIRNSRDKFSNLDVCKNFIWYRLLGPFRPLLVMFNCCLRDRIKKFNIRIDRNMKVFE
jgi:hypothetical protein